MARRDKSIKTVVLKDGKKRYRFVVDVGKKPKVDKDGRPVLGKDGRQVMVRDQRTYTYDTLKEATQERAKIVADRARGTYVAPTKKQLAEHLTEWLAGRRKLRETTLGNYRQALRPVMEKLGHVELQELTKGQMDTLVTWMLTSGRRVGTKGKPLSASTVNLMLTVLGMALDDAVRQGLVIRNVARLVDRPSGRQREMATWTAEQAAAFLAFVTEDRLSAAWCLSLYGLRRGEVLGLRWSDIDLDERRLTVNLTRSIVDGEAAREVVEAAPKTPRSRRTLPLDPGLVKALRALRSRQAAERLAAGPAYQAECRDCGDAHVFVDELGEPIHPESYSDRFAVLVRKAGLPAIRLHDTRHTCGTLMHLRGVPTAVIAAFLGHASASFTMKVYVHSQDDALRDAGSTLTQAYSVS
jgi:integrase